MELQLADIKRVADWPNWCVWPAVGALLLRSKMRSFPFRAAILISIYYFVVWLATSHYSRYLLPVYPFMAMLTAIVIRHAYQKLITKLNQNISPSKERKSILIQNILATFFLLIFSVVITQSFGKHWNEIQATSETRSSYLRKQISSFEVAEFLKLHSQYRIVQIGLESDLYYLPPNTIGDVFGPGRYANFTNISSEELNHRIRNLGANALLLPNNSDNIGARKIKETVGFLRFFSLVKSTTGAELYELKTGI
jgi:hypothetical protein